MCRTLLGRHARALALGVTLLNLFVQHVLDVDLICLFEAQVDALDNLAGMDSVKVGLARWSATNNVPSMSRT
jgi:hypothetical protein